MNENTLSDKSWPDPLKPPKTARIDFLLSEFWRQLDRLPDLLARDEQLLAARCTAAVRDLIVEMMLALNGICWPQDTVHLNSYLSPKQRDAVLKTLRTEEDGVQRWIGQAVALTVIYRWYAPQLTAKYELSYPHALEETVWNHLCASLPGWPQTITTD